MLAPLGWIYGAVTAARMSSTGERATIPIVCIGNFTAGGAGKTPVTLAVTRMLRDMGANPAIISRGHGGRIAGPCQVDAVHQDAATVGDEPLMMARRQPVFISRHRPSAAALAAGAGFGIAVMDDGLQNPSLTKDLALAVVDGAVGAGNGLCLPAGPLRAGMAAQWPHVDAVIVIGAGRPGEMIAKAARQHGKPVFTARLVPDEAVAAALRGRRVLAMAGIGRPRKFLATLEDLGADVAGTAFFADHHHFTKAELADVAARARAMGALVVTTEKDAARIGRAWRDKDHGQLTILPVMLELDDRAGLAGLLLPLVGKAAPSGGA